MVLPWPPEKNVTKRQLNRILIFIFVTWHVAFTKMNQQFNSNIKKEMNKW